MFQYCFNNPVNMYDPSGNWPKLSTILTVVAVVATVVAVAAAVVVTVGAAAATAKAVEVVSDKLTRREHTVYKLTDESKTTKYVGRTKNPGARERAHNSDGSKTAGLDFTSIASNLTYFEARGLEQIAMLEYNTKSYLNSVNGISPNNPRRDIYMEAGRQFSNYVGNKISNEILYWTGK